MLERQLRRSNHPSDKLEWLQHERCHHQTYRSKEASYWNRQFTEQSKQSKKLWRSMATLLGSNTGKNQSLNQPTDEDLLSFFNSKVASVRQATEGMPAVSNLLPLPAVFASFEPYSTDEIGKIISAIPTMSCSLDPPPTDILKEFLPELLPFIVDMCNTSLEEGCLPFGQRHAIVTPRLRKAGADQRDVKNYRPISNLTFM